MCQIWAFHEAQISQISTGCELQKCICTAFSTIERQGIADIVGHLFKSILPASYNLFARLSFLIPLKDPQPPQQKKAPSLPLRGAGLDEAILGSMNSDDPEQSGAHIADLLKNGAHTHIAKEETKAKDGEAFANEDITEILAQRTEKRQIGSRAGNTFSTAQFAAEEPQVDLSSFSTGFADGWPLDL